MYKLDKNDDLAFNVNTVQKNCPIRPPAPLNSYNSPTYSLFSSNRSIFKDPWKHSTVCSLCLNTIAQPVSPSCGQHHFCQSCLTTQNLQYIVQGICPVCIQTSNNIPDTYTGSYSSSTSGLIYPCIKLTNIPWDVSQNDIRHFFGNCRLPSPSTCIQSIHIMMDRTTGKTLSDAYIEFASVSDMRRAIETRNQKPLKGRIVCVSECSQEELLTIVFPKWRGQFQGVSAIPPTSEVLKTMSTAAGGGSSTGCPPFITREEINSLLVVCKNYKLHFSRKCAERPFENIISVIAKYPWHQTHLISTMHRDHIYEMLKLSIESIKLHLAKDYVQIDSTLLERLTRAGIMCPAFTERQKMTLLQTARIECPRDIISYLVPYMPKQKKPNTWEDADFPLDTISMFMKELDLDKQPATTNTQSSFGIPLLQKPLSPWAPSFKSKVQQQPQSDIWRINTTHVDNNRSKSLLSA